MTSTHETKPLLPATTAAAHSTTDVNSTAPHFKMPGKQQSHALLGIVCVASAAVSFSLMSAFVKYNTFSMTSMEAVFWRSFVGLMVNYTFMLYSGEHLTVPREERVKLLYRVIAGFATISLEFFAFSQMVLADASAIIFTSPVFTFFVGACVLHEKIDLPSLFFAVLSFTGLLCVVRPDFLFGYEHTTAASTDASSWLGIGSALLGAIGQAFVFISVRKLQNLHALVIVHYFMLFSIAMSLLYMAVVQQRFVVPDTWMLWASVVASGVFTGVGQMLLTKGFQLEKAGIASVMLYLNVVCVFVWDAVLLGERINHWSAVGALIICACAAVIVLRKHRSQ